MLKLLSLITLLFSINLYAQQDGNSEKTPRFAIHLLDYLAHDYGGAVLHGKVISAGEYEEQQEFAKKIFDLAQTLPEIQNEKATLAKIAKLKSLIDSKGEAVDVALVARDIQKDLIAITKITLSPTETPSLSHGKKLFQQHCISCHGDNGFGDGAAGKEMEPLPANFHEPVRMSAISAFHNYNTIRLGVPGTGMASWTQFTDKEVWDLSFYLMALRHYDVLKNTKANTVVTTDNINLTDLASLSDAELKAKMSVGDDNDKNIALALLRTKDSNTSGGDYIGKAKDYLNEALTAYKNNSREDAKRLAIQAYLEGIEPIEPMIKANNPMLVTKIEAEMSKIRQIIADPKSNELQLSAQIHITTEVFEEVEETIKSRELTFGVAFSGAFAIILREGFEAVLIVLTLLSVIKAFGSRRAAMWVHAGWSSALLLGFVAWFLSGALMKMSGASREVLEGVTSATAVVILLYFGFWLHRQTEIGRWKKFIHEKVQGAIDNKNLWALFSISFISVFREAFETVLFIRALWFQTNGEGKNAIALGLISALGLIFAFSMIAIRYSKKIPVRELFKVSSILTSVLAFILAGKAAHSMQEAGILNSTMLPWNIRFDTIGLFPTWQSIAAQVFTFLLAMVLINYNSKNQQMNKTA
ncbi:MAG: FTR1 family protein [Bacteriovorax sp.]